MELYKKFAELYLKHLLTTINLAWDQKKNLRYTSEEHLTSLINDASILHREINGEALPDETIKAVWSRANSYGFM